MTDPVQSLQTATEIVNSSANLLGSITGFLRNVAEFIGAFALASAALPKPGSGPYEAILSPIHRLINILGANFGNAKNATVETK